ncbi:class I SAM-dependent methyltransferase [Lederbergia wuyishanensis]|uniref:Ubiquinone/menaquinone biosynthesis C-methylase UbiE n=1 Tax=Lederbergia wuyishanensis TaxID=1347903 RepID=A0ABU0D3L0_9BACI|nr:class I SAM-dependent methyltransferase [Lederbergia wuyishanensis]MCJ8007845.1 class I SAM-dependent methyltransferase [Lederbergia wuyishanensis]MDQ0342987.1 ubiquinone/menaquinone biosynthesis C-methylase UbiE [Lederbergia wuyishanensis]
MLKNSEEYNDPILYDKENESYNEDISFLLKWAEKKQGPIIDLACGTGRATIPLAKEGHQLIGVDIHPSMLNEAEKKASKQNLPIKWIIQDCTEFELNVKSGLIFTVGNSFQHFLTNESQDGLLSSVHKHLEHEGIFIFGSRFPSTEELLQPSSEEYWRTYIDRETGDKVDVYTISSYDNLDQIQHYETIRKYKNTHDEIVNENRTKISLRYVFPKEMERLLSVHGFKILHVYKDWNETPITNDSYQMVYVCQKI